eukprot:Pgem_evm1s863
MKFSTVAILVAVCHNANVNTAQMINRQLTDSQIEHRNHVFELQNLRSQGLNESDVQQQTHFIKRRSVNFDTEEVKDHHHPHHHPHHHDHGHDSDVTCGYENSQAAQLQTSFVQYYPEDTRGRTAYKETRGNKRRARAIYEDEQYKNIRIKPYWEHLEKNNPRLAPEVKKYVSSAIRFLQNLLKVKPVSQPLFANHQCIQGFPTNFGYLNCAEGPNTVYGLCGNVPIPKSHTVNMFFDNTESVIQSQEVPQGFVDADMVLYVSAEETGCDESTIAFATTCTRDQFGRPIQNAINICPNKFFNIQSYTLRNDVVLHELLHAVGFSGSNLEHFTDPVTGQKPDINDIKPIVNGIPHVRTKGVVEIMRTHYNCNDFPDGMPFERLGGAGTAGSHWDQTIMNTALMTGGLSAHMHYLTPLTLAFLEDSGWYKLDYLYAGTYLYGQDAGCDLQQTCGREDYIGHKFDANSQPHISNSGVCSYDNRYINGIHVGGECKNVQLEHSSLFDQSMCDAGTRCVNTFKSYQNMDIAIQQSASCAPMKCIENNEALLIDHEGQRFKCMRGQRDILFAQNGLEQIQFRCPDVARICGLPNHQNSDLQCKYGSYSLFAKRCICQNGYKGHYCDQPDHDDIISPVRTMSANVLDTVCINVNNPSLNLASLNGRYQAVKRCWGQIFTYQNAAGINLSFDFRAHKWVLTSSQLQQNGQIQQSIYATCSIGSYEPDVTKCNGNFVQNTGHATNWAANIYVGPCAPN